MRKETIQRLPEIPGDCLSRALFLDRDDHKTEGNKDLETIVLELIRTSPIKRQLLRVA